MSNQFLPKFNKEVFASTKLKDYGSFFNSSWAIQQAAKTEKHPELTQPLMDLCLSWNGLSQAHILPTLSIKMHSDFLNGFEKSKQEETTNIITHMRHLFAEHSRDYINKIDPTAFNDLLNVAVHQSHSMPRFSVSHNQKEEMWKRYLQAPDFVRCIVPLMRQIYTGVFFAYEAFLHQCFLTVTTSDKPARTSDKNNFESQFSEAFNKSILQDCWTNQNITLAKDIRNSLAHAGGRITAALKKSKSSIPHHNNELQITAPYVKELHNILEPASEKILNETILRLSHKNHP